MYRVGLVSVECVGNGWEWLGVAGKVARVDYTLNLSSLVLGLS